MVFLQFCSRFSILFGGMVLGKYVFTKILSIRSSPFQAMRKELQSHAVAVSQSLKDPADFISRLIVDLWPNLNRAISDIVVGQVEPILAKLEIPGISHMKFASFDLGQICPRVVKAAIVPTKTPQNSCGGKNERAIAVEFVLEWYGDPNVVFEIGTLHDALPVRAKLLDVEFGGTFRILLAPLVEQFPLFGALTLGFTHAPCIKFGVSALGGDVTAIPGLEDIIVDVVEKIVARFLAWPNVILVPIVGPRSQYEYLIPQPCASLNVTLMEVFDLKISDLFGGSNPYCLLSVQKGYTWKSSIKNQLNPVYNESCELTVHDTSAQDLLVEFYDKDFMLDRDDPLGSAYVQLSELEMNKSKIVNLDLHHDTRPAGMVRLMLLLQPYKEPTKTTTVVEPMVVEKER